MQTLYKILRSLKFDDFWETFETECINVKPAKEGYKDAWDELSIMTPSIPDDYDGTPDLEILLENTFVIDGEKIITVCGWSPSEKERYAIEHVPWEVWVGLPINEVCSYTYSPERIMSHCLYEMTFCGFSNEDVKKKTKDLFDTLNDIKEQIKNDAEDYESKFMTFDEFKKKVDSGELFDNDEETDEDESI